jgi:hypothetical protein
MAAQPAREDRWRTGRRTCLTIRRNRLGFVGAPAPVVPFVTAACPGCAPNRSCKETPMKGLDQKKSDKKKPAKTMKEKRAEKQQKKAAKGR